MLAVPCPNCGAEIIFRSPALPVRVCDYCRSAVTRIGDELRALGEVAVLPFDVSPIRIGTAGRFDDAAFDIIGRIRWGWSDGSWNEWLALFADGSHGWLAEAMGQFMLTRKRRLSDFQSMMIRRMAEGGQPEIGETETFDGERYRVADIKQARCIAAEGELPFATPDGWTITSVDLRTTTGAVASFQTDGRERGLYLGRYVTLGELRVTGLREIGGWTMPRFAA
ncbi:hypothetical protein FHS96_005166 [Sphingomonas zeicaulis]|uniref:DUF4178 domain-containing protein n=1 Tax=Sphingomonas zeicaulis TaxID=1632740 RepID=UPI003D19E678